MKHNSTHKKLILASLLCIVLIILCTVTAFASETNGTGDVAGAVEDTWKEAKDQIKQVVNNVIFPIIDLILAVLFFVKVATAYLDYRKHGQFEWAAPAILLGTLIFSLTCPLYIWRILGM